MNLQTNKSNFSKWMQREMRWLSLRSPEPACWLYSCKEDNFRIVRIAFHFLTLTFHHVRFFRTDKRVSSWNSDCGSLHKDHFLFITWVKFVLTSIVLRKSFLFSFDTKSFIHCTHFGRVHFHPHAAFAGAKWLIDYPNTLLRPEWNLLVVLTLL